MKTTTIKQQTNTSQKGFTIVELMVALIVGALVSLAAFGTLSLYDQTQRQQGGFTSAVSSSTTGVDTMQYHLQLAGLGFYNNFNGTSGQPSCKKLTGAAFNGFTGYTEFLPVSITKLANGQDSVRIFYSTNILGATTTRLLNAVSIGATQLPVTNTIGFETNKTIILADGTSGQETCRVYTVDTIDTTPNPAINLTTPITEAYPDPNVGGTAPTVISPVDTIENLSFSVDPATEQLKMTQTITNGAGTVTNPAKVIADGVVQMRAQYGLSSTAADSQIIEWKDGLNTGGLSAADIPKIRAVRLALVTRNLRINTPNAGGVCDTTNAELPIWGDDTAATYTPETSQINANINATVPNWKCFRFNVQQTRVGMKNVQLGLFK